jgi:hypothetical protein
MSNKETAKLMAELSKGPVTVTPEYTDRLQRAKTMNNYHNDTTINIRLPIELKKKMQAAAELELLSLTSYIKQLAKKDAKRLGL